MSALSSSTLLLLLCSCVLLSMLYGTVFYGMLLLSTDSFLCKKPFVGAWRAWDAGVCLTEEQVWCRANDNRHVDCGTADCRAEEIRLSLWTAVSIDELRPPRKAVYSDCAYIVHDHLSAMNPSSPEWTTRTGCGVCVPPTDRRAAYLPTCDETVAKCRSLFYRPRSNPQMAKVVCEPVLPSHPTLYDDVAINARCPT